MLLFLIWLVAVGSPPALAGDCAARIGADVTALPATVALHLEEDAGCPVSATDPPSSAPATWSNRPPALNDASTWLSKRKAQKAALSLAPLLHDDAGPHQPAVLFTLAQALEQDGALLAAGVLYEALARGQAGPKLLPPAVKGLERVTAGHGDLDALTRVAMRLEHGRRPEQSRSLLAYLALTEHVRGNDYFRAKAEFERVHEGSAFYPPALYQMGLAFVPQEKLKSAVRSFRDAYRSVPRGPIGSLPEQAFRVATLSVLNIGRIYYGIERYPDADRWFALLVDPDSPAEDDVSDSNDADSIRLQRAWALFMMNRLDKAHQLLDDIGPSYLPEQHALRWTMAAAADDPATAQALVERFEAEHRPLVDTLRPLLQLPPEDALDAWRGPQGVATRHPELAAVVHRSRPLVGAIAHLAQLDAERATLQRKPKAWQADLGPTVHALLDADQQRTRRQAGLHLQRSLGAQVHLLDDLFGQARLVRLEVLDGTLRPDGVEPPDAAATRPQVIALLRELAAEEGHAEDVRAELQFRLAWRLLEEADGIIASGDPARALPLQQEAADTLRALLARDPDTPRAAEVREILAALRTGATTTP